MNKIFKRFLVIVFSLLLTVGGIAVAKNALDIRAEQAEGSKLRVYIDVMYGTSEYLKVMDSDSQYLFYTYENSSKKVPAPNKWQRVPEEGINITSIRGAKKIYFANSTIPQLEEVVKVSIPAQPKLTKASYDIWDGEFKILSGSTNVFTRAFLNGTLTTSEEFGVEFEWMYNNATEGLDFIYVELAATDEKGIAAYSTQLDMTLNNKSGFYELTGLQSRTSGGGGKELKLLRKPAAPVVTIDYNNHFVKVANNVEVTKLESKGAGAVYEEGEGLLKGAIKGKYTYYYVGDETGYYSARTKVNKGKSIESLDSEFEVMATPDFKSTISIIGGKGEDALLEMRADGLEAALSKFTYQYAILDETKKNELLSVTDGKYAFDYEKAINSSGKSVVSWKNAVQTCDKKGNTKYVNIKIANKKMPKNGCIIVREAGEGGKLSSKIMVLIPPTDDKNYWTTNKTLVKGETANISITTPTVDNVNRKIKFTVKNGKDKVNEEAYDPINIKSDKTVKINKADADIKLTDNSNDVDVEITIPPMYELNSNTFTLTLGKGFINNSYYTLTKKFKGVDLREPEVKSKTPTSTWKLASDKKTATVTTKMVLSENLATENEKGEYVVINSYTDLKDYFKITGSNYTLNKAIYTAGKTPYITFEFTYDLTKEGATDGVIDFNLESENKLYDKVGFKFQCSGVVIKANSKMIKYVES